MAAHALDEATGTQPNSRAKNNLSGRATVRMSRRALVR